MEPVDLSVKKATDTATEINNNNLLHSSHPRLFLHESFLSDNQKNIQKQSRIIAPDCCMDQTSALSLPAALLSARAAAGGGGGGGIHQFDPHKIKKESE